MFDSHAQLMVHWLGEGTNVMICLAREPPLGPLEDAKAMPPPAPSSVYFSYDYGDTFQDKTLAFNISIDGKEFNSTLDQFMTHPNYNTVSVLFIIRNCVIFSMDKYYCRLCSLTLEIKRFLRIRIMAKRSSDIC